MEVTPRKEGDPLEEFPLSRDPEDLKHTNDFEGVLEFQKPNPVVGLPDGKPKVTEDGKKVKFTVEVTKNEGLIKTKLMPKLKARPATYTMDMARWAHGRSGCRYRLLEQKRRGQPSTGG